MKVAGFWKPIIVGTLMTPISLLLAIGSAGAGHGDYFYATLLYPYTMLSALREGSIPIPFVLFCIFQFPLYGLAYSLASKRRKQGVIVTVLTVVHVSAVILCLQLANPNYC